jgi:hypothetical protein
MEKGRTPNRLISRKVFQNVYQKIREYEEGKTLLTCGEFSGDSVRHHMVKLSTERPKALCMSQHKNRILVIYEHAITSYYVSMTLCSKYYIEDKI